MTIEIGGPGDRRKLSFGSEDNTEELIAKYESEGGITAFEDTEDRRGFTIVVKRAELLAHALQDHGSADALARALGLRTEFVVRCGWYHRLDSDGLVKEPSSEFVRPTTPPWKPRPHPDSVGKAAGDYRTDPW